MLVTNDVVSFNCNTDVFISLNIVRVLSIIALVLVLASNIFTLVNDVRAVDAFVASGNSVGSSGFGATGSNSTAVYNNDYIS